MPEMSSADEEIMSQDRPADLEMFLVKDDSGKFNLYACILVGRGCERNKYRRKKAYCEDCILGRDNETLGDLQARVRGGNA